jgi:predicted nucleic acid-binding protein
VPQAVNDELSASDPVFPRREYPHATLFRHLRDRMTVVPAAEAPAPLRLFGRGEAAAIPLAQARNAMLLVNERPAAEHAANLGVAVVTVPAVVVLLHVTEVISRRAAHRKLDLLASVTTPGYVEAARRLIDQAEQP